MLCFLVFLQESSEAAHLLPVPAESIDHTATPVQEADLVSSKVIAPKAVADTPEKDVSGSKANDGHSDQVGSILCICACTTCI